MAVNLAHLEITSDALPGSRRFLESAGGGSSWQRHTVSSHAFSGTSYIRDTITEGLHMHTSFVRCLDQEGAAAGKMLLCLRAE